MTLSCLTEDISSASQGDGTLLFSRGVALRGGFAGQASIIDGDTLEIHGNRIRLWGINAPETDQLCRAEDSQQFRCGARALKQS